jgi:hypothetical protein
MAIVAAAERNTIEGGQRAVARQPSIAASVQRLRPDIGNARRFGLSFLLVEGRGPGTITGGVR